MKNNPISPHILLEGTAKPVQNIFCIGRNYAKHIAELNNATPTEPMVFLKPTSALHQEGSPILLPAFSQSVHYEAELVLYIANGARNISEEVALQFIGGFGVGLDLTARDLQTMAKERGEPWTKSKGFPHAATLSPFVASDRLSFEKPIEFTFSQNGKLKQHGKSDMMLYNIAQLVSHLSHIYGLSPGDLIFTGTPEGVGELRDGDQLTLQLLSQTQGNPPLIESQFLVAGHSPSITDATAP